MRPLSGVLVTLPVELLIEDKSNQLESVAETVRARLDEIHRQLSIEVPIYLVLTKTDAVEGFDEFFDQLSREESRQVLGSTFGKGERGTDIDVVGKALLKGWPLGSDQFKTALQAKVKRQVLPAKRGRPFKINTTAK